MSLEDTYSQHLPSLELSQFQKRGNKLLQHSITISHTSEDVLLKTYNIYEWSKNTRTNIRTSMLYYNIPTLACASNILAGLTESYTHFGKVSGDMELAIIKRHVAKALKFSAM